MGGVVRAGSSLAVGAGASDRAHLVSVLTQVAGPVLEPLSEGKLKGVFPIKDWDRKREDCTRTEAFARTLDGIAPWIELETDGKTEEGRMREKFGVLARESLIQATNPASPDFMSFGPSKTVGTQPLVEAAFLAQALLRAPHVLWDPLTPAQKQNVVAALKASRALKAGDNNWVLFPAIVEAALWHLTGEVDMTRLKPGVDEMWMWYRGDGTYGDGPEFHWDYYNSYVIHPLLLDILAVCREKNDPLGARYDEELRRAQRYAVVLERMISPEGSFPILGRSSAYRFGAFHGLAEIILLKQLPQELDPGATRAALTSVIRRMMTAPGTFDAQGWLNIGAVGNQPSIRNAYNSTGSLYFCLTALLPLGLPPDNRFWQSPDGDWTQKKIWSGQDAAADHALESH